MSILCAKRPATLVGDTETEIALDQEFAAARWAHHQLLNFEDKFQGHLDAVSELVAPRLLRCGSILARLNHLEERAKRTTKGKWKPRPRPELKRFCEIEKKRLREVRNADPRWKEALGWADAVDDKDTSEKDPPRRRRGKDPTKIKRKKNESEEKYSARLAKLTRDETDEELEERSKKRCNLRGRREHHRYKFYHERRCHAETWNGLVVSVDQARSAVLRERAKGMPASWNRPEYGRPQSITRTAKTFRVIEKGPLWWTLELPLYENRKVRFKAKFGSWHNVPEEATCKELKLRRVPRGRKHIYSISLVFDGVEKQVSATRASEGRVALDWGHREHGHPSAHEGLRVFTWLGDDGSKGEVLLPRECRDLLDQKDALKSRADTVFAARNVPQKNRYTYRRYLERLGCLTEEESNWLVWEQRYKFRIEYIEKRIANLRQETYTKAVIELRKKYKQFAIEDEENWSHKKRAKEEMEPRRKRQNRDLSARYLFVTICERFGAEMIEVPSRNSTKECPFCHTLGENGPELVTACGACGKVRDKDYGACQVILARAEEALANHAA